MKRDAQPSKPEKQKPKTPPALDAVVKRILAYRPASKRGKQVESTR